MASLPKSHTKIESGDFQTPLPLARAVTAKLRSLGVTARSILEPTCGLGSFLLAAAEAFPEAEAIFGFERSPHYVFQTANSLPVQQDGRIHVEQADFFRNDWKKLFRLSDAPWLILGNPPWVTNSGLGAIGGKNLPQKSNSNGSIGIEAITGKSNFDISEFMVLKYLEWLDGAGTVAVLLKTSVARKVLAAVWKKGISAQCRIYKIDAWQEFGVCVEACLFVLQLQTVSVSRTCKLYESLTSGSPSSTLSPYKGYLVLDGSQAHLNELWGPEKDLLWRSGIKHDCAKVMELYGDAADYTNGYGERADMEEMFLYPMLKSSDVANGRTRSRAKMLVPQTVAGEITSPIRLLAPRTWSYLEKHGEQLAKRNSSIYRNKPEYSIFGVGPYSFTPWKLAISSFYKRLSFTLVGPENGRPVVFDDTVSFLPCTSEQQAKLLLHMLSSREAINFYESIVHWPDKRPLTIDLLRRLSLSKLAVLLGQQEVFRKLSNVATDPEPCQQCLFPSV